MSPPPLVMPVVQNNSNTNANASVATTYTASSSSLSSSSSLDGLPKQFVIAMRTLFDIMDDKGAGFVKFSEIENRWQDDGTKGLPKGVIESLRKVTPPNGLLSFERFCAGLKICLLKNQVEGRSSQSVRNLASDQPISSSAPARPTSAPLLDIDHHKPSSTQWNNANTATVRPNNAISSSSTSSLQSCQVPSDASLGIPLVKQHHHGALYGPPKPPRSNLAAIERSSNSVTGTESRSLLDKQEIRTVLHNWQLGLMNINNNKSSTNLSTLSDQPPTQIQFNSNSSNSSNNGNIGTGTVMPSNTMSGHHKKLSGQGGTSRRKEPRRHTLQNGIDYNMLKRMKQIEQEKEVLMQGLQAVEKARDWYIKQITAVQEKMKYLGRMPSHMEQWSEAQQERLELQRARVLEVNRHLATLTDCGERGGLPLHMNLAINHHHHHHHLSHTSPHVLSRLKQQNHLLNEELSKKSERITLLEREKASLIRELFQSRAQIRKTDQQQQQLQDAFM
ncbi:suppressor APC domain-containing protein 2 [Lycorma delicatula]|uniref:suppressor APC domain-containing protein 2 n=1 Tax=Lycorma delicatula TaxID=130591 RepID=UPI003F510749